MKNIILLLLLLCSLSFNSKPISHKEVCFYHKEDDTINQCVLRYNRTRVRTQSKKSQIIESQYKIIELSKEK